MWTTAVLASTHTHPYSPSHSLSPLPLLTLSLFRSPPRIFIHLTVFIVFCLCLRCLLTLFRQFFLSKKTNADAAAAAAYFLCCAFQGYYSKAGSPVLAFLLANVLIWEGHFIKRAESVSARERERERERERSEEEGLVKRQKRHARMSTPKLSACVRVCVHASVCAQSNEQTERRTHCSE